MPKIRLTLIVAFCIAVAAPAAFAGDSAADAADRQQARDHAAEVHRMKENFKEHGSDSQRRDDYSQGDPMERARDRNKKAEEGEAPEEDADEDGVDSSE